MRRLGPSEWSGIAILVVCVGAGIPVVLGAVEPDIPIALWLIAFVAMFAALVAAAGSNRAVVRYGAYAVAVLLGWVVVLTAPTAGLLPVVLVVIAAFGPEIIKLPANLLVVALNTVVIVLSVARTGAELVDLLIGGGFYALIQVAAVLSVTAILREQRMRRELTGAHVELQAASVLLAESARTAERLRISRDLHDLVGHQLTVLTLELEAARHRDDDEIRDHVVRANQVARDLLADLRSAVGALRAEPGTDLAQALRNVGRDVPGLDVAVEVADDVEADEEQTAALVRAMQEIVTNTLRHAEARELWIDVVREGEAVRLTAVDDGRGASDVVPGNGLRGLSERFAGLGGEVDYDGSDGFRVTARVSGRASA